MRKLFATFLLLCLTGTANASNELRLIVPFAAGGVFDIVARRYANFVETNYSQVVVVENATGAGSIVGTQKLLNSDKKDVALFTSGSFYVNIVKNTFSEDQFRVSSIVGEAPFALAVHKDSGHTCQSITQSTQPIFIGHAGKDSGSAIPPLVMSEKYPNIIEVPFRGISQALLDLIARRVDIVFVGSVIHDRPELTLLANTGVRPYKDLPGWNECIGIQQDIKTNWVIATRADASDELVQKLNTWAAAFVMDPATKKFFNDNGILSTAGNLTQTTRKNKELMRDWQKIYSK